MTTPEAEIQPKDNSSTSTSMADLTYDEWANLIYDKWEDLHAADASQLGPLFTPEESEEIDALLKVWIYPVYGQQADLCAADALLEGQRPVQMPLHSEGVFPPKPFVQAPLCFENSAQSCNVTGLDWGVFTKWEGAYRNISPSESSSLPVFYFPQSSFDSASPSPPPRIHLASSEQTAIEGQASHIPTYIVGIGGGPSSGKSTLALHLSNFFKKLGQNSRVFTVSQDAYILPPADCPHITLRSVPRFVAEDLTEEYFDEVAWPAYKAYHSHHEPEDDGSRPATYKELLRWAMDQIFKANVVVGHPYRKGQGGQ
ncbi:hypothetical protein CSIM01_02773 [Colletotrichum simmondsii]|uniref:Uncharacterized protein n=1 Tax=Colletotrichum simmondsii TaxID=703756 RepID=A0A135T1D9_9PEZI|nr:hypothetical protein CSIM01_02773 [Colletotrichum simmondsii]